MPASNFNFINFGFVLFSSRCSICKMLFVELASLTKMTLNDYLSRCTIITSFLGFALHDTTNNNFLLLADVNKKLFS